MWPDEVGRAGLRNGGPEMHVENGLRVMREDVERSGRNEGGVS